MLRVLHVIPTMSGSDGGPTFAVVRMATALASCGNLEVSVATTYSDWRKAELRKRILQRFSERVSVNTFPAWPIVQPRAFSPRMLSWLNQHVSTFDLVHLHSMFNWYSLTVPLLCHSRGVPIVMRPAGSLDKWARSQKSWKKRPYFDLVEKHNLRSAARIHVMSEAERQSVAELGFGEKTRCIPIGLDLPQVNWRKRSSLEGLRILFLSRLHPGKNLETLLRAIGHVDLFSRPPTLVIAGDGKRDYVRELHRIAEGLSLGHRICFLGHVDGLEKERLYGEADVFALPSFHESFGLAVAEAMAFGLPVVIGANVALASHVRSAGAGEVVEELSPRELAKSLARFEDTEHQSRASRAARKLVVSEFSNNAMLRGLISMYREIGLDARGTCIEDVCETDR